jgi:hypothetical protein
MAAVSVDMSRNRDDFMYQKTKARPASAQTLRERIEAIRAEIDAIIDAKVAGAKVEAPGVPEESIRSIEVRGACPCQYYLRQSREEK